MKSNRLKRVFSPPGRASRMMETVVGCKWSLQVLGAIRQGVLRPGALVRSLPGLTRKVLTERLSKMMRYGILEKRVFPEVPPRVEYRITPFGRRFTRIIDALQRLDSPSSVSRTRKSH